MGKRQGDDLSEFELMYLRFMQCQRDFPKLNHQPEHGPDPTCQTYAEIRRHVWSNGKKAYTPPNWTEAAIMLANHRRAFCEREFNRSYFSGSNP